MPSYPSKRSESMPSVIQQKFVTVSLPKNALSKPLAEALRYLAELAERQYKLVEIVALEYEIKIVMLMGSDHSELITTPFDMLPPNSIRRQTLKPDTES